MNVRVALDASEKAVRQNGVAPRREQTKGGSIVLKKTRQAIGQGILVIIELAGLVLSLSGAAVALFLGKLFAAAVLGVLTLGVFLRLAGRRDKIKIIEPKPTPPWIHFISAALAVVEVSILAEATNLPVRYNQPGFEKVNWLLVCLALLAMFYIQIIFLRSAMGRRNANTQRIQP